MSIELRAIEERDIVSTKILYQKKFTQLAIFSHFDEDCIVDEYVIFALKELFKLKFDIVFVTTSEKIHSSELAKIEKYLFMYVVKRNCGYDFMSWKMGLSLVPDYKKYKTILHINDSIFFPLVNPKKMFDVMSKKQLDCWSLVDSYKQHYHLESFFWVVTSRLIKSKIYEQFWNQCSILQEKNEIIQKYEMGFAPLFIQHKFHCASYIEFEQVLNKLNEKYLTKKTEDLKHKRSFNLFWDVIIKDFKAPFIKKKILQEQHIEYNPTTFAYENILNSYTRYDVRLIKSYLAKQKYSNQSEQLFRIQIFFMNAIILEKIINDLCQRRDMVIYGFGEVGYLIYSNLEKNVNKIVDRSYESLQKRYFKIHKFYSIEKIEITDKIILGAFGREKVVKDILMAHHIKSENVISIGEMLKNPLKFANNITKLFYNFDALYRLSIEKDYDLTFCSSCEPLNQMIKNYCIVNCMEDISIEIEQEVDCIYFWLQQDGRLIRKIDFNLA